jgi:hypothetical protein
VKFQFATKKGKFLDFLPRRRYSSFERLPEAKTMVP